MGKGRTNRNFVALVLIVFFSKSVIYSYDDIYLSDPQRRKCDLGIDRLAGCLCEESYSGTDRHLICSHQNLLAIPSNISNLLNFKVIGDNFQILKDTIPYSGLKDLHLEHNHIRFIVDSYFRYLRNLVTLSLAENELSSLTSKTFEGLDSLELLILSGNKVFEIRAEVFSGNNMPSLQILKLDRCSLYAIEPLSFSGLNHLTTLNIANNYIEHLPVVGSRNGLNNLRVLNASDNRLKLIDNTFFVNMPSLASLYLDRNFLTELKNETFRESLTFLTLRGNQISSIEVGSLYRLQNLRVLDLSKNLLTQINPSEPPWDELEKFLIHDNPWDCNGCNNSWIVEEDIVRKWNFENNVSCATPNDVSGLNIYQNEPNMFVGCDAKTLKPASVSSLPVIIGISVSMLVLSSAFFLLVKFKLLNQKKVNAKGEMASLAYHKMRPSGGDDEEQEL